MRKFLLVGACSVLSLSCIPHSTSQTHHTTGQPVRDLGPAPRQEVSFQDYVRLVLPHVAPVATEADVLKPNDPLSQKVERALYKLHSSASGLLAGQNIPTPHAVVFRDPQPNAFVEPVTLGLRLPVLLHPELPQGRIVQEALTVTREGALMESDLYLPQPTDPVRLQALIGWSNHIHADCKISLETAGARLSPGCMKNQRWNSFAKGEILGLSVVPSVIAFSNTLLSIAQDDGELMALIAHELAHYYKADPLIPAHSKRFFYRPTKEWPQTKPLPDPEYMSLAADLKTNQAQIVSLMSQGKLAYYTEEQEADDFSLELLSLSGTDPHKAISLLMGLLKQYKPTGDAWDSVRCAQALQKEFEGAFANPPLGDPHHSVCYRILNIFQELKAHKYH